MMDLRGLAARECARPEPAPTPGTVDVTAHLLAMMRAAGVSPDVVADVEARAAFGRAKYGTTLHADNGRDHAVDLRQELADACQYAAAGIMAGQSDEVARVLDRYMVVLSWLRRLAR